MTLSTLLIQALSMTLEWFKLVKSNREIKFLHSTCWCEGRLQTTPARAVSIVIGGKSNLVLSKQYLSYDIVFI